MDKFYAIKAAVVNYLSPPAKRRRTLGPETPSILTAAQLFSVASEPQGAKARANQQERRDSSFESPSLSKLNIRKRARESFEDESQDDEENLEDSISHREEKLTDEEDEGVGDKSENVRPQMSAEEKVKTYLKRQEEHETKKATIKGIKERADWHRDEFALYEKIQLRSFEPLLPWSWKIDFPTIPDYMFTDVEEHPFFAAKFGDETHARRKLQELIANAQRISSMLAFQGRTAAQILCSSIRRYIIWSEKDGGYSHLPFIPVIVLVQAKPGEAMDELSQRTKERMHGLATRHRQNLALQVKGEVDGADAKIIYAKTPPVIYGILVVQRDAIFFTMDSSNEQGDPKYIADFTFDDSKMAFWNAIAVGILVILARNYMISDKDDEEDEKIEQKLI